MDRRIALIKSIQEAVETERIKHVQVLMVGYKGRMAIKLNYIDNEHYAAKVDEIVSRYCESLEPARILKTTRIYYI